MYLGGKMFFHVTVTFVQVYLGALCSVNFLPSLSAGWTPQDVLSHRDRLVAVCRREAAFNGGVVGVYR